MVFSEVLVMWCSVRYELCGVQRCISYVVFSEVLAMWCSARYYLCGVQ